MTDNMRFSLPMALLTTLSLAACGGAGESSQPQPATADTVAAKPAAEAALTGSSPGKPTAPISMRYEIVGNPIVGAPALINIHVSSAQGPVTVNYSITDTSALMFQQGQVQRLEIVDPSAAGGMQQLTVIPQREGRLYVNVSAEVQTPGGAMIRSMAIPIKVGAAPAEVRPNGEVLEGPDGETVISMPAQESH